MHTFPDFNYVVYSKIDMFFNSNTIFINVKQHHILFLYILVLHWIGKIFFVDIAVMSEKKIYIIKKILSRLSQ